jgi:hypothetical protein
MSFTITYTFSGLKRPGAALQPQSQDMGPMDNQILVNSVIPMPPPPLPGSLMAISDAELAELRREMAQRKAAKE